MHNVLYILYDGLTDPLGQSQVLPYLKGLSQHQIKFTIISCEKAERFAQFQKEIEESISSYPIEWHPLVYHKSPPVLSTLYDIKNITRKAHYLHIHNDFSAVHCRSYISAIVGLWMKQQFNVKFIFDMRGFWADERVDGNIWNLKNPLFKAIFNYFKKKENQFLSNSDHTISLTNAARKIIHSWKSVENQPIPISVIPCCVDTERFSTEKLDVTIQKEFKARHHIAKEDFILSYLGSIGTWYMLDEMLDFFAVLYSKNKHAKFLFLTTEPAEMITKSAASKGIPLDRLIIQKAAFKDVPSIISISDVSMFFIKPAFSKQASSPVKHAELMSLGIPVICNTQIGDVDEIILKTGTGLLIDEFSTRGYEKAIESLAELQSIDPNEIRKSAEEIYGLEMGVSSYLKVYTELFKTNAIEA